MDCCFISGKNLNCAPMNNRKLINSKGGSWCVVALTYIKPAPTASNCISEEQGKEAVLQLLESRMATQSADTGVKTMKTQHDRKGSLVLFIGDIFGGNNITVTVTSSATDTKNDDFARLEQVLGKSNFTFDCEIQFGTKGCASGFIAEDIPLTYISTIEPRKGLRFSLPCTPAQIQRWEKTPETLNVSVCLTLNMNDKALNFTLMTHPTSNYGHLMDKLCSGCMDATVVAQQMQCPVHKAYLSAVSTKMGAMFDHAMENNASNEIRLKDMTQHAVQALLEYLYGLDVTEMLKSCEVAYELLRAGHNYRIQRLRHIAGLIILVKDVTWFNPTVTAKLLAFARSNLRGDCYEFFKGIEEKAAALAEI